MKAKVQDNIQSDVKIFLMTEKHRKDVTDIPFCLRQILDNAKMERKVEEIFEKVPSS